MEPNFNWSFKEKKLQLLAIAGTAFGDDPEVALPRLREFKRAEAAQSADVLKLTRDDVVAEIGSGYGFWAAFTAERAKKVFCLDISREFLDLCADTTQALPNVERCLIQPNDLSCLRGKGLTKIYSAGVFIHFNIFDITIYLSQLFELLPSRGLVMFNIANSDSDAPVLQNELFQYSLQTYREDKRSFFTNMYWNSPGTVARLARQIGFGVSGLGNSRDMYEWFLLHKP